MLQHCVHPTYLGISCSLEEVLEFEDLIQALSQPPYGGACVPEPMYAVMKTLPRAYSAQCRRERTTETLEQVKRLFAQTDADGSGLLDADEVCMRLTAAQSRLEDSYVCLLGG